MARLLYALGFMLANVLVAKSRSNHTVVPRIAYRPLLPLAREAITSERRLLGEQRKLFR